MEEKDIEKLQDRVRPINHSDIPDDALIVTCKNQAVNAFNTQKLSRIQEKEHNIEAIVKTHAQKIIKANIDTSGVVRNTPLQKTLNLKIGARVMLTYNIDTCDSLTNGTFGTIVDFDLNTMKGVRRVFICFNKNYSMFCKFTLPPYFS